MSDWKIQTYKSEWESYSTSFSVFANINLPDLRLKKRLIHCMSSLLRNPGGAFSKTFNNWSAIKAWYRLVSNDRVKTEVLMSYLGKTTAKISHSKRRIFAVSDTTEVSLPNTQIRQSMGYGTKSKKSRAFFVHTTLSVDESGIPLGILHQKSWKRDDSKHGKKADRHKRPIEEKESFKWFESVQGTLESFKELDTSPHIIMIGDRESDIFEYFEYIRQEGIDAIVRSSQNRRIENSDSLLWDTVIRQPPAYQVSFTVPRRPRKQSRAVELSIKYATDLHLKKPDKIKGHRPSVPVNMIIVEELNPVNSKDAICWRIITTLPISSGLDAWEVAQHYKYRWVVEEFHYILKSGCRIEKLQFETFERYVKALAILSEVSLELLRFKYLSRVKPNLPASDFISPDHLHVLRLKVKLNHWRAPPEPMTIKDAVILIARIGGFLARKSDGDPGVKTLWIGWNEVCAIAEMIPILKEECS